MWRPLEIFLYDWWPIRSEARLQDRLAVMPVRIAYTTDTRSERGGWTTAVTVDEPRIDGRAAEA